MAPTDTEEEVEQQPTETVQAKPARRDGEET
jgi:hypothetical protein